MRKTILSLSAAMLLPLGANADDVVTLKVTGSDGAVKEYNIDEVRRLTFQDETFTMTFTGNQAEATFRYDDVLKMQFGNNDDTAVRNIAAESDLTICYDGNVLRIDGAAEAAQLMIFDVSGRPVMKQRVMGHAEIGTENLSAGIYILKINNKTFKFSKQ